jgi:tRNA(Ile2) C34 agmatinyltransferase TiaS
MMERHDSAAKAPTFWNDLTPRPHCPECRMRMISIAAAQGKRSYECLRCGHAGDAVAEVLR